MNLSYIRFCLSLVLVLNTGIAHALTIVQMEMQFDNALTDVYYELFDETAPVNVNNYLGYITRGDYDNSFIHRKGQNSSGETFVLQGGGFTYVPDFDFDARFYATFGTTTLMKFADPVTGELGLRPIGETYVVDADNNDVPDVDISGNTIIRVNDGLHTVPVDQSSLPVTSEVAISNVRGTLAMALTAAGPNSATNQWFVNMKDNTFLDTQNGGFTVFGRVIGNGMNFFDDVSNRTVINAFGAVVNPAFGEIPLINYEPFTLVLDENLVKIKTAKAILNLNISTHDFGYVGAGLSSQIAITLTVASQLASNLLISKLGDTETLSSPYGVTSDCIPVPIAPGGTCTLTVYFQPSNVGYFEDKLDISFTDPGIPNITLNFSGSSILQPRVEAIPDSTIDFRYGYPGLSKSRSIYLRNIGNQALTFNNMSLSNTNDYSFTNDCTSLNYKETCQITVTFLPQNEGLKTGVITIDTNDPGSPFLISLTGTGSTTVVPDIDAVSQLDLGDTLYGSTLRGSFDVTNIGSWMALTRRISRSTQTAQPPCRLISHVQFLLLSPHRCRVSRTRNSKSHLMIRMNPCWRYPYWQRTATIPTTFRMPSSNWRLTAATETTTGYRIICSQTSFPYKARKEIS